MRCANPESDGSGCASITSAKSCSCDVPAKTTSVKASSGRTRNRPRLRKTTQKTARARTKSRWTCFGHSWDTNASHWVLCARALMQVGTRVASNLFALSQDALSVETAVCCPSEWKFQSERSKFCFPFQKSIFKPKHKTVDRKFCQTEKQQQHRRHGWIVDQVKAHWGARVSFLINLTRTKNEF